MQDDRDPSRLRQAFALARGNARLPLLLLVAFLVVVLAWSLTRDRWGLEAEYRSQVDWVGNVLLRQVEPDPSIAVETIAIGKRSAYSVRWTGWISVEDPGGHFFSTRSSGNSYVDVRGERVVENEGGVPPQQQIGKIHLRRGLHRIEIGFSKNPGRWHLHKTFFGRKAARLGPLPAASLYETKPGRYRQMVRSITTRLSPTGAQFLGGALFLAALFLAWLALQPYRNALRAAWLGAKAQIASPQVDRRWRAAFLLALFVVAFVASLPFTGSPYGYDDLLYMQAAKATEPLPWILNRYAHIYILKVFIGLEGGDAFAGSELYWSFMFAATVAAMGLAIMSLGRRFQVLTLIVSVLLLLSQPMFFDRLGSAYSDYTATTLVTVGVALYLYALARSRDGTWRWVAFALGLVTLWAVKSKELGAVLLWLVPLLAFESGRLDWKRGIKRAAYWAGGAAVGLLALMVLDAIFLNDFFFAIRPENINRVSSFNFAARPESDAGWMATLWRGHPIANPGDASSGILSIFVLLAAAAASWKQRTFELRVLHLMPLGYLAALILMHMRATYPYIPRYLYPILPVACVLAAALFHYAGLDDVDWGKLTSPRVFVPALLVVAAPWMVLRLIPFDDFEEAGWAPEHLLARVVMPLVLMALLSVLFVFFQNRAVRLSILLFAGALVFAPYFHQTQWLLARRTAVHRAANSLYPFKAFEKELKETKVHRILVSRDVVATYRMCGGYKLACKRIVRLLLGQDVELIISDAYDPGPTFVLASISDVEFWEQSEPEVRSRATFDPSNSFALIRSPHVPLPPSIWTRAVP